MSFWEYFERPLNIHLCHLLSLGRTVKDHSNKILRNVKCTLFYTLHLKAPCDVRPEAFRIFILQIWVSFLLPKDNIDDLNEKTKTK